MFGLSKVWSYVIGIGAIVLIAGSLWFYAVNIGKKSEQVQVARDNGAQIEKAREVDSQIITEIIRETKVINTQTDQVKEVIREVPATTINPVSLSRLERVWEQQRSSDSSDNTNGSTTNLPE